jgi:hypothetical protein
MDLCEQRGLDAGAGLIVRPKPIAKQLDHVVGGDAEVRVAVLDHLENGLQHGDDGAVRAVHAFVEPAQAVEVTEGFVSAYAAEQEISESEALDKGLKEKSVEFADKAGEVYLKV